MLLATSDGEGPANAAFAYAFCPLEKASSVTVSNDSGKDTICDTLQDEWVAKTEQRIIREKDKEMN